VIESLESCVATADAPGMQPNLLITVIATARDRELRRRTLTSKRGRR